MGGAKRKKKAGGAKVSQITCATKEQKSFTKHTPLSSQGVQPIKEHN